MADKNVLLILCDQLRKDSLGCYGNPYARTPHLDALAQQSARFERCYVANPICSPNRMSIFSGMYPRNHGVWTNGLAYRETSMLLQNCLHEQGYQTANIGKIHFSPTDCNRPDVASPEAGWVWDDTRADYDNHGPYAGFEYMELTTGHQRQKGHYRQWFFENGGTEEMFELTRRTGDGMSGAMHIPPHLHSSSFVGERTCAFLREKRDPDRPFFLVASFPDPHHPFDPPQELDERWRERDVKPPVGDGADVATRPEHYRRHLDGAWNRFGLKDAATPGGLPKEWEWDRIRKTYAMVELIDENVGKILQTLRQEGLEEDTIVIFTSDHGELLGDHGLWLKGPFFYDGLVNVPLMVKGAQKGVHSSLVSSVDISPMICTMIGREIPPFTDGVSPVEADGTVTGGREKCLIEYRTGYVPNDTASYALVDGRFKYVRHQTGEEELTDLQADPEEKVNQLGEEYEDVRRRMALEMLDMFISTGAQFPEQVCHA